jgi:hypothetical protein
MNLGIEYLIRSGELKEIVQLPYSIFLNEAETKTPLVITIHGKKDYLLVKHWLLDKCKEENCVPPFVEYKVHPSELFTSDKIIVPNYDILWYKERSFIAGGKQNTDGILAEKDETEYNNCLSNMLNSSLHKQARAKWIFSYFVLTYHTKHLFYFCDDDISFLIKRFFPERQRQWYLWHRYLLNYSNEVGQVASELLFHKEYAEKCIKENREPGYLEKVNYGPFPFKTYQQFF